MILYAERKYILDHIKAWQTYRMLFKKLLIMCLIGFAGTEAVLTMPYDGSVLFLMAWKHIMYGLAAGCLLLLCRYFVLIRKGTAFYIGVHQCMLSYDGEVFKGSQLLSDGRRETFTLPISSIAWITADTMPGFTVCVKKDWITSGFATLPDGRKALYIYGTAYSEVDMRELFIRLAEEASVKNKGRADKWRWPDMERMKKAPGLAALFMFLFIPSRLAESLLPIRYAGFYYIGTAAVLAAAINLVKRGRRKRDNEENIREMEYDLDKVLDARP